MKHVGVVLAVAEKLVGSVPVGVVHLMTGVLSVMVGVVVGWSVGMRGGCVITFSSSYYFTFSQIHNTKVNSGLL